MGKDLFGQGGISGSDGRLGETLGNLLQQGLGSRGTPASPQDQLKAPPADRKSPIDSIMKQLVGR
jgi:hypothetical protein